MADPGEWRTDFENAPQDGTLIDLWWDSGPGEQFRVPDCEYHNSESWIGCGGIIIPRGYITHWRFPPEPPE